MLVFQKFAFWKLGDVNDSINIMTVIYNSIYFHGKNCFFSIDFWESDETI